MFIMHIDFIVHIIYIMFITGIIIIWLFMVLYSAVKRLSLPCEDVQHANMAPRR